MQRKPFWKLLLAGAGYMMLGSIMSAIMTVSTAALIDAVIIKVVLLVFTMFIFISLIFAAAYKDGVFEAKLVSNKRVGDDIKNRWIAVGLCMYAIMCVPSVLMLIFSGLQGSGEFMYFYYFFNGGVYPLLLVMISTTTAVVDITVPLVVMAIYLLVPVAAYIGYDFGFKNRFNSEIMYKK